MKLHIMYCQPQVMIVMGYCCQILILLSRLCCAMPVFPRHTHITYTHWADGYIRRPCSAVWEPLSRPRPQHRAGYIIWTCRKEASVISNHKGMTSEFFKQMELIHVSAFLSSYCNVWASLVFVLMHAPHLSTHVQPSSRALFINI